MPIGHSRSPQLHLAAYRALGLTGWTYERIECSAEDLPGLVAGLGPEWVGLSVLALADERTERAERVGSANTLVRTAAGWRADNTDIDGVAGALGAVTGRAIVLGSGGTAPAAVAGLAAIGAEHVTVVARNPARAAPLLDLAAGLGIGARYRPLEDAELRAAVAEASVAVNTVPADVAAPFADALAPIPVLLDAIYDPWPTPLASAVRSAGGRVVSGLQMLLHQACTQVELFTGRPAPRAQMAAAID